MRAERSALGTPEKPANEIQQALIKSCDALSNCCSSRAEAFGITDLDESVHINIVGEPAYPVMSKALPFAALQVERRKVEVSSS